MTLNHRHRQFLQHLRSGDWVKAISLPDSPGVIAKLVENGWIEKRGEGSELYYRMTASGLAAKAAPVRI